MNNNAAFLFQVLESVVKNCGQTVHDEVASKQTMEELKDLLKVTFIWLLSVVSHSCCLISIIMLSVSVFRLQQSNCFKTWVFTLVVVNIMFLLWSWICWQRTGAVIESRLRLHYQSIQWFFKKCSWLLIRVQGNVLKCLVLFHQQSKTHRFFSLQWWKTVKSRKFSANWLNKRMFHVSSG